MTTRTLAPELTERSPADAEQRMFSSRQSLVLSFMIAVAIYAIAQRLNVIGVFRDLTLPDSDDAVRLVNVRDLLAGQSWFDLTQHRILPPEGVSMHWSRMIDAALAAMITAFGVVLTPELAERATAAIWPMGLFVAYLAVVATMARSAFGIPGACYALFFAAVAPPYYSNYFSAGRIDHHNVQILVVALLASSLLLRGSAVRLGLLGGAAAAVSLAVGLEMIMALVAAGVVLVGRYVGGRAGSAAQIAGFGVAFAAGSAIVFVGQTPPSQWLASTCDSLSLPWLVLAGTGGGAGIVLAAVSPRITAPSRRLAAVAAVAVVALLITAPLLQPCLAGPYAALPAEARTIIAEAITEAMPFHRAVIANTTTAIAMVGPLVCAAILLAVAAFKVEDQCERRAVVVLLLFVGLGIVFGQLQLRAFLLGWVVMPIASGYLVWKASIWPGARNAAATTVIIALCALLLFGQSWGAATLPFKASANGGPVKLDAECLHPAEIAGLAELPPMRILAPLNFGTALLLGTHHSVLAAPYHRSPDAFLNGYVPFVGEEADMLAVVDRFDPDHIIVCHGQTYGSPLSFGSGLSLGKGAPWLQRVELGDTPLMLWRNLRHTGAEATPR